MKITNKKGFLTVLSSVILAIVNPAFAQTQIEIGYETPAFENRELTMGAVKVLVNYKPFNVEQGDSFEDKNLSYRIFYDGVKKREEKIFINNNCSIYLKDLDGNNLPEVIFSVRIQVEGN